MALSYVEYPSSGSTKAFDLTFGYLSRTHVFAFVNDTLAAYTWISPTRIELVNIPPENATIKIARLTDRVTRLTSFADGQTLLSGDLNAGDLQNFYILQEIADGVADGVVAGTIVVQNPGEGYITEQWIQDQLQAAVGGSDALSELNDLIDQEVTNRNAAILAEQQARAAALVAEANTRAAALVAEANARAVLAQDLADEELARAQGDAAEAAARAVVAQNLAAETTARTQAIASEAAARATAVQAEATARAAALQAEATARADDVLALEAADLGLGQRLTTVESDINTATTGLKAKVATLTTTTTDLATNKADASVVTAIDAKIEAPTTGLKARATSLESRTTAVETGKASTTVTDAISADLNTPTTGLKARATSLESRVTTVETDKASVASVSAIDAKIETPTTGLKARATSLESRVSTVETDKASTTALTALTSRVTTAESDIDAVEALNTTQNGRLTTAEGSITTLQATTSNLQTGKADASVVTALTSRVTTAEADIDAVEAVNVAQGNRLTTAESGITTLNTTTANLATNKADASTVTALSATVTTVSGVADSKAKTFRQTAAPTTGMQDGDLWIDSDDGNKLYMRVSGVWTAVDDARVATTAASLVTESSARVSADNSQVSRLNSLEATVNTPTTGLSARVTSSETAITDLTTNKASVSSVSAIDAKIETPTTGLAARATSLEGRMSTVETGKAATTVTDAIDAKIETPTTGLKARATSLETRMTTAETGKASTTVTDAIDAKIEAPTTGLKARATSLETRTTAVETGKASTTVTDAIDAKIETPTTGLKARATSLESRVTTVETDKATVSSVSAVDAKIETPTTGLLARATSLETRVSTVETGKASTSVTDTLSADLNTPTTGLKARATSLESRVSTVETGKAATTVTDAIDAKIETPTTGLKARATSLETRMTTAETNKAEASTVTALTARVASGAATGLIANSRFAEALVAGVPTGWANWANGNLGSLVPRWIHTSGNAFRLAGPVNAGGGVSANNFPANSIRGGSRFRVLIEAVLVSGTYDGSGVFIDWRDASNVALSPDVRIGLANTADTSGVTSNSAAGFRAWDVEVVAPANAVRANFYVMSHWSGHAGGQAVANSIDWHLADLVPTTSRITTAESNITTLQTTTANLQNNKAEASTVTTLTATVNANDVKAGSVKANLLVNSSGLRGLTGWTNPGGWQTYSHPLWGQWFARTMTGQSVTEQFFSDTMPASPGESYSVSFVPYYQGITSGGTNVCLGFYNSSGTFISQSAGLTMSSALNRVRQVEQNIIAPAGTATMRFIYTIYGPAVGSASYAEVGFWQAKVEHGATATSWRADSDLSTGLANITTLQSTVVDLQNNKASATEVTSLRASVTPRLGQAPGSILVNPAFSDYPVASGTVPPGWSDWANGGPPSSRGTGKVGLYAHVRDGNASADSGIVQQRTIAPGKYVMKCTIDRLAGTLTSAGVYMQFFNSGGTLIGDKAFAFELTPDTRGNVGVSVGYDYRQFDRPFTVPANTTTINVYLMNHWGGGLGSNAVYNQIAWHQLDVVAADYGVAEVDILKSAMATESSSEARLLLKVNTSTNVASIEGLAQSGDGVWNGSAISLTADKIKLQGDVIVTGTLTANEVQSNSLTKSAADVKTSSQSVTTTYADLQSITLNVPTGASLVKLDWAMRIDGRSLNSTPCQTVVRVLRDGTDITGDIVMSELEGVTTFDLFYGGTRSASDYVEVEYVVNGSFAAFALDVGASAGNRVYTLQVKKDTAGATYTVRRSTLFGVGHAR